MSEPITLYHTKSDAECIMYGPTIAQAMVDTGEWAYSRPAPVTAEVVPTPDVVPMSKRVGRPRKGDGVL